MYMAFLCVQNFKIYQVGHRLFKLKYYTHVHVKLYKISDYDYTMADVAV